MDCSAIPVVAMLFRSEECVVHHRLLGGDRVRVPAPCFGESCRTERSSTALHRGTRCSLRLRTASMPPLLLFDPLGCCHQRGLRRERIAGDRVDGLKEVVTAVDDAQSRRCAPHAPYVRWPIPEWLWRTDKHHGRHAWARLQFTNEPTNTTTPSYSGHVAPPYWKRK